MDDIARDEGRPAVAGSDPVHPFLVVEGSSRAERHDEDERLRAVRRRQGVVDDPHLDGLEERERSPWEPMQEIEHRIPPVGMLGVAGGQVDVRLLGAAAERRARYGQSLNSARPGDEGRLAGGREAAIREVVVEIAARAEEPHAQERAESGGQCRVEAYWPRQRHNVYVAWLR
jgi:hypothetical protein